MNIKKGKENPKHQKGKKMYWNYDSFGGYSPANWEDICDAANQKIDAFMEAHPEYDSYEFQAYSEQLWEEFCRSNEIDGVVADYSNAEL